MCTVVIEVPQDRAGATRILAVRDEDLRRPWDPPGEWWPDELPGVIGVRDRLANGAWLAISAAHGKLAVILNRAGSDTDPLTPQGTPGALLSRGSLVLDSVRGDSVSDEPGTAPFNFVEIDGPQSVVTSWDGTNVTRTQLEPGVHMVAHHGIDDFTTARIERWLPEFQTLEGLGTSWRKEWNSLLERTAALHPDDDRAIIRDNHVHGYPTQSLIVVTAEVRADAVDLEHTILSPELR